MQCQYHTKVQDSSKTEGIVKVGNIRRRTRTVKIRTALSRPCPAELTDNGQLFSEIWTESRHEKIRTDRHRTEFILKVSTESGQQTDIGHDFPGNPDKNETVLSADVWLGIKYYLWK